MTLAALRALVVQPTMGATAIMVERRDLAALLDAIEELRAELMQPRFRDRFLSALEAGVGQCDRTCMRLYAEAVKLVGQQLDLSVLIVNQLGADAPYARAAVDIRREAEGLDEHETARMARDTLLAYCSRHGKSVDEFLADASGAEVVEAHEASNGGPSGESGHENGKS